MKIRGKIDKFIKIAPIIMRYSVGIKLESKVPNGIKMKIERCLKDTIR